MGHSIQPRTQRKIPIAGSQAGVGAHKNVLKGVLGILPTGQHLPRIGEQPLAIPVVNDPECLVVAGAEQGYELFVRAKTK